MICPRCHGSGEVCSRPESAKVMKLSRMASGLSIRKFSKLVGLSHTYVVEVESGYKTISNAMRQKLEGMFDTTKLAGELSEDIDREVQSNGIESGEGVKGLGHEAEVP